MRLLTVLLAALSVGAAGGPKPPPQDRTRLVSVLAAVIDRNGVPVAGLQRPDFTVLDKGKP